MSLFNKGKKSASNHQSAASRSAGLGIFEQLENRRMFASGLAATYYRASDFAEPVAARTDAMVNFNWTSAPVQGIAAADGFSARWTGQVKPKFSEYYTFFTRSDGGVRLWVNGQLVIDNANNNTLVEQSAKLRYKFIAGQTYNVQLDFVNTRGSDDQSKLQLMWSSTRTAKAVIPTDRLLATNTNNTRYKISFRDSSSAVPTGYRADNGAAYGRRPGGYIYGWDADNSAYDFDRNSTLSFSERYDGGAQMQPHGANRSWSIAVPNGSYNVRVVAGDAANTHDVYAINVEGIAAVRGTASQYSHWFDGTVTVNVTDGKITITNGAGAVGNKINFVEITRADDSANLISWKTIGFSTNDPSATSTTRFVSPSLLEGGWQGYVDREIAPQVAAGIKRFVLHNPFGISDGRTMQLDQYLEAKDQGLSWLTDGFAEAFKPLIKSGVEVIAYVGFPDEQFQALAAQGDMTGWFNRFYASLKPMLDAGMSIALDGAVGHTESDPLYAAAQQLRARDVNVYVEARIEKQNIQWVNFPLICEETFWQTMSDPTYVNAQWAVPNNELTHEVIRWVEFPPQGLTWYSRNWVGPESLGIMQDGDAAAIPADRLIQDNVSVSSLVTQVNGYVTPPPVTTSFSSVPQIGDTLAGSLGDSIKKEIGL